jgi:toxin ParE1/3/4
MIIEIDSAARAEVDNAVAWYEAQRAGLGLEFLREVERAIETIVEMPSSWPLWPNVSGLRVLVQRFLIHRFPYAIAYQAFPDHVIILAVAHSSRKPGYWLGRLDRH